MAELISKCLGGMVGSALGDAIGELAFRFGTREYLCTQVDASSELRYTDDSAMSIGLAESITECKGLDQEHLGEKFRNNYRREPWRGYAPGPPRIFSMVERQGITYAEAAKEMFGGKGSYGNGAAMRIVPVGLYFHDSTSLYEKASVSAAVTHAHPVGMDGAAVQAKAVALAVSLDPAREIEVNEFIEELIEFSETGKIRDKMLVVKDSLASNASPSTAADLIGRSVAIFESMPFALYSFLSNPRSFEECLFCAILNGGDRDTLGAMAGAVSGAFLGIECIPGNWRQKLENISYIENLAFSLSRKRD